MKQLTVKQAIEQGYTLCGKDRGEWNTLDRLEDIANEDIGDGLVLAEKEGINPLISEEDLKDMIADRIADDWNDETGDDTLNVYYLIKEMDFSEMAKQINEKISSVKSYKLTDIALIKE